MDEKLIIETLANAVRQGKLTLEQVPDEYKEEVTALLQ